MKKFYLFLAMALAFTVDAAAQPLLVGHRGSGYGVESTEEAFRKAAELGYQYVESDLKVTRDKRFVLSHDDDTKRLGGSYTIATSSLEQLQSQTLKQTRNGVTYTGRLMSLEEWLDLCEELELKPLIELKWATGVNNNDCSNIPLLIETIEYYGFRDRCIIMTSMKPCLEYIRKNYPDIELQFLTGEYWANHFDWCVEHGIDADIQAGYFDANTVAKYHQAGLKVNMWTTNDVASYRKYAQWGCDFVTTDRLDGNTLPIVLPEEPRPAPEPVDLRFERLWVRSTVGGDAPEHIHGTNAQQGTAVNGLFYVNDCSDKLIYVFRDGDCIGSMPGGSGWGCCRDEAGNIIVRDDKLSGNTHKFIIYPAGATPENPGRVRSFECEVPVAGQTNFINAAGDVLSDDGGYIYLYPNKAKRANIIDVALGNFISARQSEELAIEGSAAGYIVPTGNLLYNWYYQVRNQGIYYYRGEISEDFMTGSASTNTPLRNSTGGFAVIEFKNNIICLHNSGANYKGGFTVRNMTEGVVTSIDPIGTLGYEEGGNYSTFNWLIPEEQQPGEWYIYQYCPSNGMAVYRLYDELMLGTTGLEAADRCYLSLEGRTLSVNGLDSKEMLEVYGLAGLKVAAGSVLGTDVSALAPGIYIVRAGGNAYKITLR
ncbi:MAG: hypothetical protein K2M00_08685 [Muribaculaceae bacterium]|nr:hypothetical protein [Muribaculaceae bacterium]